MNEYIFRFGSFGVKWYSFLILCGILLALYLANKEAKKHDLPKDIIFDSGFWVVIFGILGARLHYVIFNFNLYKGDIVGIFRIWEGGLAIHGGIIVGFITLLAYCKMNKQPLWKLTDIAVPSIIIAQAIGRWGNFFNQEAHGPVTTLENLQHLHIPSFVIKGMNIGGIYYHPTFLYESLWCLLGFIVLLLVRKYYKYLKTGQLTCIYLMWYGLGRLFIESLRTDSLMVGNFKVAQLISIIFIGIGLLCFIYLCFNKLKKGLYYNPEKKKAK